MSVLAIPLGALGAVLGAFVGGYLFNYVMLRGIYMPLLVGGIAGFMTIGFARRGGLILGVIAAAVSLVGTMLAPWMAQPLPRPELGDWVSGEFRQSTLLVVLLLASPALAFLIVWRTPPRPPKSSGQS